MKRNILFIFTALLVILSAGETYSQMFWNHAAKFENSDYMAIPNSPALNLTGSFTLEAWIRPTSIIGGKYILSKNINGSYGLALTNGRLAILTNGQFRLLSRANSSFALNDWEHVAATYNSQTNKFTIYIEGRLDTSATVDGAAPLSGTDSLLIGKYHLSHFSGTLDEVRIWNRALSEEEIKRNHRTPLALTAPTGFYSGLKMSLPFQGNDAVGGLSLKDWTGLGLAANNGAEDVNLENRLSMTHSYNEALQFDGIEDYVISPHVPDTEIDEAATLEAWVYINEAAPAGEEQVILKRWASNAGFQLSVNSENFLTSKINFFSLSSQAPLPIKRWVHVAFTITDKGAGKFYIDGILQGSGSFPILLPTGSDLYIGGTPQGDNFNGYIDEVRITEDVKSAADIKSGMYTSIETGNNTFVNTTVIGFNCDGSAFSNTIPGVTFKFIGDAKFSAPSTVMEAPISPVLRSDASSFPEGFRIKTANKKIDKAPFLIGETFDTLTITDSVIINDINIFFAPNHTHDAKLVAKLFSPDGDSLLLTLNNAPITPKCGDIITVFDGESPGSLLGGGYTYFAPTVKPAQFPANVFNGKNARGKWVLKISNQSNSDSGMVYAWGLQINNWESVGIQQLSNSVAEKYSLSQNYPNPFNPVTNIKFNIQKTGIVKLAVYDILGKQVATLVNEVKQPGAYVVDFDASQLSSGVYFYRLETEAFTDTKRMLLVK